MLSNWWLARPRDEVSADRPCNWQRGSVLSLPTHSCQDSRVTRGGAPTPWLLDAPLPRDLQQLLAVGSEAHVDLDELLRAGAGACSPHTASFCS